MAQQPTQTVTNTFIRGLVTEGGPLTFPENASVDELNCVLERDGSRRNRLGIQFEKDYFVSTLAAPESAVITTYVWENVGSRSNTTFLVLQVNSMLHFYNMNNSSISPHKLPTTINMNTYVVDTSRIGRVPIQAAVVNGYLIVVSPATNAFVVSWDGLTLTHSEINMQERDFEWLSTDLVDPFTPQSVDTGTANGRLRKYDLWNAGWNGDGGGAALTAYNTSESNGPPLTHPWYSGKKSDGTFDVDEYKKVYSGNTLTVNGHLIGGIFGKNRASQSGIINIPGSLEFSRFSTVAAYAGRAFYSGMNDSNTNRSNRVYFSQLVKDNKSNLGKCYQVNDPTSEEFSDLLDTDGGYISISGAYNIKKLHVFGPTLYVFAENGVWAISGVDDVFRASEFSVSKLSEVGLQEPESFVSADGRPYWWSSVGIHTLVLNDQVGTIVEQDICQSTILKYFRAIPFKSREKVKATYDPRNKRVYWIYPDEYGSINRNKVLIFDEVFTAFVPWKIEGPNSLLDVVYTPVIGESISTEVVTDNDLATVTNNDAEDVEAELVYADFTNSIKFLTLTTNNGVTFSEIGDKSCLDWGEHGYDSFAESGYDFQGDLTVFKNVPYVTVYCKQTEEGYTFDSDTLSYFPIMEGSLTLQPIWDFKKDLTSSKQQVYRLRRPLLIDPERLNENQWPNTDFSTRLKVRGRGRSLRLRFEGEHGKAWHLLGWEVVGARNPTI